MGSILETIKKGISALNPVGTPVNTKPVVPAPAPTPRPNPKLLGPMGSGYRDAAERAKKYNETIEDVASQLDKS